MVTMRRVIGILARNDFVFLKLIFSVEVLRSLKTFSGVYLKDFTDKREIELSITCLLSHGGAEY